jgi:tetratricopeptide (TPR) repeat protein
MRRPEQATACLSMAVEAAPENVSIYTAYLNALAVQGVRCFHNGNLDMAEQIFRFLEKGDYRTILVYVYLGIIEKELGNFSSALDYTAAAIQLSPDDPLLQLRRVTLLFQLGERAAGMAEMERLKERYPDIRNFQPGGSNEDRFMAVSLFQEKKYVKSVFHAKKVLRRDKDDVDMHLLIGEAYRLLGEREKARNHFDLSIKKNRKRSESYYGLAMVLWEMGQYEEVLTILDKIERVEGPGNVLSYYRALCRSELEYPVEESLAAVQDALRQHGADPFLMNTLGKEYLRTDLPDLAEKWFLKSIKVAGENVASEMGLIRVYQKLGDVKKLIDSYGRYLDLQPDDLEIRKELIKLLMEKEQYKAARKEIIRHDAYGKREKSFQGLLALCCMKTGDFSEAAVLYRQLLRKEPDNIMFLRGLVYCYDQSGNTKNAAFFLEKALAYLKPTSHLLLILGVLQYKDGNTEKALETFRKALSISKGDWRAYQNIGIIYRNKGITEFADMFLARAESYRAKENAGKINKTS